MTPLRSTLEQNLGWIVPALLPGGKALLGPKPGLFDGKVAVIAGPVGAAIGLFKWSHEPLLGGHQPPGRCRPFRPPREPQAAGKLL